MISYTIFSTSPRVLGKTRAGWANLRVRVGQNANPTRPATQPNPNRAGQPDPCRSLYLLDNKGLYQSLYGILILGIRII
jgi:hypothetical protein